MDADSLVVTMLLSDIIDRKVDVKVLAEYVIRENRSKSFGLNSV